MTPDEGRWLDERNAGTDIAARILKEYAEGKNRNGVFGGKEMREAAEAIVAAEQRAAREAFERTREATVAICDRDEQKEAIHSQERGPHPGWAVVGVRVAIRALTYEQVMGGTNHPVRLAEDGALEAAEAERAAIVAWLRRDERVLDEIAGGDDWPSLADAIERGAHEGGGT